MRVEKKSTISNQYQVGDLVGNLNFTDLPRILLDEDCRKNEVDLISNIQAKAKELGVSLEDLKISYYPLGQFNVAPIMAMCPKIEKIIITGAEGFGPTSFDDFDRETINNLAAMDSLFGFTKTTEFDSFDNFPTLLLIAASIHNRYGVNQFEIIKTEFGHSIHFEMGGQKKEVEYIDFFLDQNPDQEDDKTRKYLVNIKADLLIHKAIPLENLSDIPSSIAVLTGNIGKDSLVISDCCYLECGSSKIHQTPTEVFVDNVSEGRAVVSCPDSEEFGYGTEVFLTLAKHLIPIDDLRRTPSYIERIQSPSHSVHVESVKSMEPDARDEKKQKVLLSQ